jgi:hypothetical protein
MGRDYLKGRHGDRCNAVLPLPGYNFRLLLRWLVRLLRALIRVLLPTPWCRLYGAAARSGSCPAAVSGIFRAASTALSGFGMGSLFGADSHPPGYCRLSFPLALSSEITRIPEARSKGSPRGLFALLTGSKTSFTDFNKVNRRPPVCQGCGVTLRSERQEAGRGEVWSCSLMTL